MLLYFNLTEGLETIAKQNFYVVEIKLLKIKMKRDFDGI